MYKFNSLIIGFGSIGRKHAKILSKKKYIKNIYIYSKIKKISARYKKILSLDQINFFNIKYIIICNETSLHYDYLKFLNDKFSKKIILVEKPLFHKNLNFKTKKQNKIFIGYNLRYHPALINLKKFLKKKKVWYVNSNCLSFLPNWRKNIEYQKSYSANKKLGGGVLLDLSHEIDYIFWLFGNLKVDYSFIKKISDLDINTEDYAKIIAKAKRIFIQLELSYFSLIPKRSLYVEGKNFSAYVDLIKNIIKITNKNKVKIKRYILSKEYTYSKEHDDLILNKGRNSSTILDGLKIMKLVSKIKK
jgi:predicted dehydrogenase